MAKPYSIYTVISCTLIFLLSIFLRSTMDIGSDTGSYIDIGKKIYEGKKYYYDFFEGNFPLSFYFYALQYKLAAVSGIDAILMSEIFVNLLGLGTILWSAKILTKVNFDNKHHRNLLVISFFLAFFLRLQGLVIAEFGTKTSFVLMLLFPYLSYSFLEKNILSTKDLICRGVLIGLMPCLKPHYIIFPLIIESYKLYQEKSWNFFKRLDILTAALVMALYLNFMVKFTPEYIEYMIAMWKEFYSSYSDSKIFYQNILAILSNKILFGCLILPMFVYHKISKNDKIYLLFFIASSLLLIAENITTSDQLSIFYGVATIVLVKFYYDFYFSKYFNFTQNNFIILSLIFIPFFDFKNSFYCFFYIVRSWWILVPFIFLYYAKYKKELIKIENKKFISCFVFYLLICFFEIYFEINEFKESAKTLSLASLILILFFFEDAYKKTYKKFSPLLIAVVTLYCSYIAHSYIKSTKDVFLHEGDFLLPNQSTEQMARILQIHATQEKDSFFVISPWIYHQFPLTNYLHKTNPHLLAIAYDFDTKAQNGLFSSNPSRAFVFNYLMDDLKKQLQDKNVKVIFVNNISSIVMKRYCVISLLEYYMRDVEFRKLFLQNFHFETRILEYKKNEINSGNKRLNEDNSIQPSKEKLLHDFEVYVRN